MYVWRYVYMMADAHGSHRHPSGLDDIQSQTSMEVTDVEVTDIHLELELHVVLSWPTWVLTTKPFLPPHYHFFHKVHRHAHRGKNGANLSEVSLTQKFPLEAPITWSPLDCLAPMGHCHAWLGNIKVLGLTFQSNQGFEFRDLLGLYRSKIFNINFISLW